MSAVIKSDDQGHWV